MDSKQFAEMIEAIGRLTAAIEDHTDAVRDNTDALREKDGGEGDEATMD